MLGLWEFFWNTSDWVPGPPPVTSTTYEGRIYRLQHLSRMSRLAPTSSNLPQLSSPAMREVQATPQLLPPAPQWQGSVL